MTITREALLDLLEKRDLAIKEWGEAECAYRNKSITNAERLDSFLAGVRKTNAEKTLQAAMELYCEQAAAPEAQADE